MLEMVDFLLLIASVIHHVPKTVQILMMIKRLFKSVSNQLLPILSKSIIILPL